MKKLFNVKDAVASSLEHLSAIVKTLDETAVASFEKIIGDGVKPSLNRSEKGLKGFYPALADSFTPSPNRSTDQILDKLAMSVGGWRVLFIALAIAFSLSLIAHGQPAYALFTGARDAAKSGIGKYIEEDNATSLIDTITFGMWALAAIGGIAVIAGGATQNIQVLIGGIVLFFGMAVLIGLLEFTDGLIFSTTPAT